MKHLTDRESQIVQRISTGASNREIAAHFGIAEATVKNHVKHALWKLGCRNRVGLALWFLGDRPEAQP